MARKKFFGIASTVDVGGVLTVLATADVSVFQAGTSTPVSVYSSETAPSPTTIQTNSDGEYEFWLELIPDNQRIKIIVEKVGFSPITQDNVTAFEDADTMAVDTSSFDGILSGADDTPQKCFDTVDDHGHMPGQVGLGNVTNHSQLKRAAADFSAFVPKSTPVSADKILIEDSEDGEEKKVVDLSDLPSSGENNTASNIGTTGQGFFKQKSGVDLEFRKLKPADSKVNIFGDGDEVAVGLNENNIVHDNLSGAGTISHSTLDTDVPLNNAHRSGDGSDHAQVSTNESDILSHVGDFANPHTVTKTQVGLSAVTNDAQLKRAANDFTSFDQETAPDYNEVFLLERNEDGSKRYILRTDLLGVHAEWFPAVASSTPNGDFITQAVAKGGTGQFNCRFSPVGRTIQSVTLIGIAAAAEASPSNYDLYSDYGAVGEVYNNHSESSLGAILTASIDNILSIDLTPVLSAFAPGDFAGIRIDHDLNGTINYLGICVQYNK